jgi:hypothetical protein
MEFRPLSFSLTSTRERVLLYFSFVEILWSVIDLDGLCVDVARCQTDVFTRL